MEPPRTIHRRKAVAPLKRGAARRKLLGAVKAIHRRKAVAPFHSLLAPGTSMPARTHVGINYGYAQISPLSTGLAKRTARNSGKCGPECEIDLRFHPSPGSLSGASWDQQDQLPTVSKLPLHHITRYSMHLITM